MKRSFCRLVEFQNLRPISADVDSNLKQLLYQLKYSFTLKQNLTWPIYTFKNDFYTGTVSLAQQSLTFGLYYKTITIVIMTIVKDATNSSVTYDRLYFYNTGQRHYDRKLCLSVSKIHSHLRYDRFMDIVS